MAIQEKSYNLSIGSLVILHDTVLGVGSYGKVCKAKCGQLPCAAKLLHETMIEGNDPGRFKFAEKFVSIPTLSSIWGLQDIQRQGWYF